MQFGTPAFLSALGAIGVRRKAENAVAGIVLADGKGITIPRFLRIRTWVCPVCPQVLPCRQSAIEERPLLLYAADFFCVLFAASDVSDANGIDNVMAVPSLPD